MSGTLPGIALAANNDLNGIPLGGCKLRIYQAGGVVIQTAFADPALSVALSWPLLGDAYGRIPFFWLPDGNYRVLLTDANDVVIYSCASLPAVGASAGSGGGGGGIDPNAIYQTGDVKWLDSTAVLPGWLRNNGRTFGSATSGASERANSDCQSLYTYGWAKGWTVVGGTGASAAADWAANKPITLPDWRGYIFGALDDMGNTSAGRFASVPIISGSVTTAGSVIGETLHTLTTGQMPAHTHTASVTDPGHSHTVGLASVGGSTTAQGGGTQVTTEATSISATGVTVSNSSVGGGGAHNNVQLTVLGTVYRKL